MHIYKEDKLYTDYRKQKSATPDSKVLVQKLPKQNLILVQYIGLSSSAAGPNGWLTAHTEHQSRFGM